MSVTSVRILVIYLLDASLCLLIVAAACIELVNDSLFNLVCYLISACLRKAAEPLSYLSVVRKAEVIKKSLKI